MILKGDELKRILTERGYFWIHDGNPKRPHAILSKGEHATGFVNLHAASKDPQLTCKIATSIIIRMAQSVGHDFWRIQTIMGSASASLAISHEVARQLSCNWIYIHKKDPQGKEMVCGFDVEPGEVVVAVEDLQTTGHTTKASIACVMERQPEAVILPVTACAFAWNNPLEDLPGFTVLAVAEDHMQKYPPDNCPLCRAGSQALKPKHANNWTLLTADYPK